MKKCKDCIYAKPAQTDWEKSTLECIWNRRCHWPEHECEIHSFFPKKREKPPAKGAAPS